MCGASEAPGPRVIHTAGPQETEALGADLARGLGPGDRVLVSGELGAGKTTLIRGGCRALGVRGAVTSPTFTLGHLYPTDAVAVSHLDLYRLASLEHEDLDLLEPYLNQRTITFVEWPEHAVGLRGRIRITIEHAGADQRRVEIAEDPPQTVPSRR